MRYVEEKDVEQACIPAYLKAKSEIQVMIGLEISMPFCLAARENQINCQDY